MRFPKERDEIRNTHFTSAVFVSMGVVSCFSLHLIWPKLILFLYKERLVKCFIFCQHLLTEHAVEEVVQKCVEAVT